MQFRTIFYVNGFLLLILSAFMLLPVLVDLAHDNADWKVFAVSQMVTAFFGFSLLFSSRQNKFHMGLKETFLLTSLSWILLSAFGSLPFMIGQTRLDFSKAFFETASAITTTGSTAISGLDNLPQGILLWRHLLQWLGGIGVIVIALAILPLLQISGMQIYKSQSFGEVDKVLPTAGQMAFHICIVYALFTLICAVLLHNAGMTGFDAICHAMSTVSTAGFSTHDASIGFFKNPTIEYIIIAFMLLGALPYVLYLRASRGDARPLVSDSQVRFFLALIVFFTCCLTLYTFFGGFYNFSDSFRNALFSVTTILTTTGFTTVDYTQWGGFAVALVFVMTFAGSCSGSTSGGLKIFRLQILWLMLQQQTRKLLSPNGVILVHYNGKIVDNQLQAAVAGFFFLYILTWLVFGVLLQLTGLDFVSAFSGALTAISNVGPGIGSIIGPAGNFSSLPDSSLWLLSFAMLLGRLEFLTLLVILTPGFWRN